MFLMFTNFSLKQCTLFLFAYSSLLSVAMLYSDNNTYSKYVAILACPRVTFESSNDNFLSNGSVVNCAKLFRQRVEEAGAYLRCKNGRRLERYDGCDFVRHASYNASTSAEERKFPLAFRFARRGCKRRKRAISSPLTRFAAS